MKIYNPHTGWKLVSEAEKREIIHPFDIRLRNLYLKRLPRFLSKIDKVFNWFDCNSNVLTSLKNCPKEVKFFNCSNNKIASLKGGPEYANEYYCFSNKLTSLEGSPQIVQSFDCSENELRSLTGGPVIIENKFFCNINKLTTLKGGPEFVGDFFNCADNELSSLEGFPKVGKMDTLLFDLERNDYVPTIWSKSHPKGQGLSRGAILNSICIWNNPGHFTDDEIEVASRKAFNK